MQLLNRVKRLITEEIDRRGFVRGHVNKSDRQGMLHKAWGYVFTNHIHGDYVEFGVYKGDSLANSFNNYMKFKDWLDGQMTSSEKWRGEVAKAYIDHKVTFHGLDTFEGMPSNDEHNVTFAEGTFQTSLSEVMKKCSDIGLKKPALKLYKGLFDDSRDQFSKNLEGKKISILNVDCDLYVSAKSALEMAEPYLQVGSVILFDDYNTFNADQTKGERKAFQEFANNSKFIFEPWDSYHFVGQSFLCIGLRN